MKRPKLYKLIIAALVIINVGMLVFMLLAKPPHPHGKPEPLSDRLGITGEKRTTLEALEKNHHKEKRLLMAKDRKLHEVLFSKLGTDENVSKIQAEIKTNYSEIEQMTFNYFNEVAQLCTPEQLKELKKAIHHAFDSMRRPPGKK